MLSIAPSTRAQLLTDHFSLLSKHVLHPGFHADHSFPRLNLPHHLINLIARLDLSALSGQLCKPSTLRQ